MKRALIWLLCCLLLAGCAQAEPRALESLAEIPETGDDGFLPEGEEPVYYRDHAGGHWFFLSQSLHLEITRYHSKSPLMTWYLADIICAPGSSLYTVTWNTSRPGRTNGLPQDMALQARAVYAQSGDFYSYRVKNDRYPGYIVRDGKILYKKSYSKMVHATPNLATMGFYPSGRAEVNESWTKTAGEYVKEGATTVLAFGPILLQDGEIQDLSDKAYRHREPRSCIGIIDTGHYVGLVVEARNGLSDGATLQECAEILADIGCWDALNLDGGNTTAMLFMGESVMQNSSGGVLVNDRAIPDILAVGQY